MLEGESTEELFILVSNTALVKDGPCSLVTRIWAHYLRHVELGWHRGRASGRVYQIRKRLGAHVGSGTGGGAHILTAAQP